MNAEVNMGWEYNVHLDTSQDGEDHYMLEKIMEKIISRFSKAARSENGLRIFFQSGWISTFKKACGACCRILPAFGLRAGIAM